ncbi:MAG: hypothetical protein WCK28_00145 [Burkholderiales bacterium]|jgi:hypothetical protein
MSGFFGLGITLLATARRQGKISRLWSLFDGFATWSFPNAITDTSPRTLSAGSQVQVYSGGTGTLAGVLTGTGLLTKVNAGEITISNAGNTGWSGGLTINGGAVRVGSATALGTGTVTLNSGTTLYLQGFTPANTIVNNGGTVVP